MQRRFSNAIKLNLATVRFLVTKSGLPQKSILPSHSTKTLQRVLNTGYASPAVAHQLAQRLNVTLDDLQRDTPSDNWPDALPQLWLYEDLTQIDSTERWISFISSGFNGLALDSSPISAINPLTQALDRIGRRNRSVVLRRTAQDFQLEIRQFHEAPKEGPPNFFFPMGCRFFPVTRTGDSISRTPLTSKQIDFMWASLHSWALNNTDLLSVDGACEAQHPDDYKVLVRFFEGEPAKQTLIGSRLYRHLNGDFRCALIDYIESMDTTTRISAHSTFAGTEIEAMPSLRYLNEPDWQQRYKTVRVNLVQEVSRGELHIAPWRSAFRHTFTTGVTSRKWKDCWHHGHSYPGQDLDYESVPPLAPDPALEHNGALRIKCPTPTDAWLALWETTGVDA
ncbi:hypothetical protein [Pseudoduganella sp. OTU4001]|uniref:hypothetical protein n=1 Tax=Pseudoduganella sp. OTU4001 TaxID=3043854 RepID=UPI00313EE740